MRSMGWRYKCGGFNVVKVPWQHPISEARFTLYSWWLLPDAKINKNDIWCGVNGHLSLHTRTIRNWELDKSFGTRHRVIYPLYEFDLKEQSDIVLASCWEYWAVAASSIKEGVVFKTTIVRIYILTLRYRASTKILEETIAYAPISSAKASFGFGDVNACAIF